MVLNTSGLLLIENNDGSLEIGYNDYNVEFFGGGDYDVSYTIEKKDAIILKEYLSTKHKGTLKEMLICEIGKNMSEIKFKKLLNTLNICPRRDSWISFDDHY